MQRCGAGGRFHHGGAVADELRGVYPMTAEIIPMKQKDQQPDHLAEVDAGLTLLKMFHRTGGHNQQTISLIMAKMTDDLAKAREQTERR